MLWRRLDAWAEGYRTYLGPISALFAFPALGGFLFGYDVGATALALVALQDPAAAGVSWGKDIERSALLRGLFASSVVGGALLGTLIVLCGAANALGRRRELIVAAGLYGIGGLLEFASGWVEQCGLALSIVSRWIYGCGVGFAMHAAPAYIAEMSPPSLRGTLVALKEAAIVLGILVGQVAGLALRDVERGWTWAFFVAAPIAFVMGLGMYALPPSCRWLGQQGRWDEAEESLRFFLRSGVGACIEEIRASCGPEDTRATLLAGTRVGGWRQRAAALFNRRYRWPLLVGLGCVVFQQISGQPSVLYYTSEVFNDVGLPDSAVLGVGGFKLAATLVSVVTVERFGRRRLLVVGTGLMLLALCALAFAFHFYNAAEGDHGGSSSSSSSSGALDAGIIAAFMAYIGGYQVGFGPCSWILVAEIFPLEVRSEAVALAVSANFLANLLVTLLFDSIRKALHTSGSFALFTVICCVALLFIVVLVPETKGLSLEEVEKLFASGAATGSHPISLSSLFACGRGPPGDTPTTAPLYAPPRQRSLSQQGSNGNIVAFIEGLLPVEKSDPNASPYSSMLGGTPATSAPSTLSSAGGGGGNDPGSPSKKSPRKEHKITLSV